MEMIFYSKLLHPLRIRVLNGLETLFAANERESWLAMYLSIFILLHSCSMITRRDEEFAKQLGRTVGLQNSIMEEPSH